MTKESCNWCDTNCVTSSTLLQFFTDEELKIKIEAVEANGRIGDCGFNRKTCQPMVLISREIRRRKNDIRE